MMLIILFNRKKNNTNEDKETNKPDRNNKYEDKEITKPNSPNEHEVNGNKVLVSIKDINVEIEERVSDISEEKIYLPCE